MIVESVRYLWCFDGENYRVCLYMFRVIVSMIKMFYVLYLDINLLIYVLLLIVVKLEFIMYLMDIKWKML